MNERNALSKKTATIIISQKVNDNPKYIDDDEGVCTFQLKKSTPEVTRCHIPFTRPFTTLHF